MKTIIILGMHRSATSLVAKGLANEIFMGSDLMPANAGNTKGYFESMAFVDLNNRILHAAGGNWRNPPGRAAIMGQEPRFRGEILQTLEQHYAQAAYKKYSVCGFKDPRSTLTIWLYQPWLQNAHYVTVWRQPGQIAQSLLRRDKMPVAQGKKLAQYYQQEMAAFMASL